MKCTRILFEGYKRFAQTECDVSPRLLAFVGPNEAGKTSILTGLNWLTEAVDEEREATPLTALDKCRSNRKASGWVVGARFRLDEEDKAVLEPLGFDEVPTGFSLWKQVDGGLNLLFSPSDLNREPKPFMAALEALTASQARLSKHLAGPFEDPDDNPATWVTRVLTILEDRERQWTDNEVETAEEFVEWLASPPPSGKAPRAAKAARLIQAATDIARQEHPNQAGLRLMRERCPKFVLYRPEDRDLPTVSPIESRASRGNVRPAIRNVVRIAGINLPQLWALHDSKDTGEVQTTLDTGNARLHDFFSQAWNQSDVSVALDVNDDGLLTHILDLKTRRFTRMEERSEGLRAFVALAAFLKAQNLDVPPVLLVDEADAHLHLNAQADLVSLLMKQDQAAQVLYTTHSPGCLPSDLGTGIRLVERDDSTSAIESHFWTNKAPGFGSLLYAMGANAAAFSTCRRAVLAEGPSDMIMLPTLLRLAIGEPELDYQIAPGLSNARAFNMEVEEIAARVVYLTDGDGDGKRYRRDLLAADVAEQRIFSLPDGMGAEDLLDPNFYLETVAALLPKDIRKPSTSIVQQGKPIALSLTQWAKRQRPQVKLPSKVAVAYQVIESTDVRLSRRASKVLADLHRRIETALSPLTREG